MYLAGNVIALLLSPFSISHPLTNNLGIAQVSVSRYMTEANTYVTRYNAYNTTDGYLNNLRLSTYSDDYIEVSEYTIMFTDHKNHSGHFKFTSGNTSNLRNITGIHSEDPDVGFYSNGMGYNAGLIFFYNKNIVKFCIIRSVLHGQSTSTSDAGFDEFDLTFSDLVEYDTPGSIDDIVPLINALYQQVETNEIAAWQYWQLLGGIQSDDNGSLFHSHMSMANYSNDSTYTLSKSFLIRKYEPLYITFYSTNYNLGNNIPDLYTNSDTVTSFNFDRIQYFESRGLYYYTFKISLPDDSPVNVLRGEIEWKMTSGNVKVIPVYFGSGSGLSNDQKSAYGIDDDIAKPEVNNNDSITNSLNSAASQEQTIAATQESQFNDAIGQINTSNPLAGLTDLANSATWVRNRFNELTTSTAFGTILGFSLLLGLALAIVGRIM